VIWDIQVQYSHYHDGLSPGLVALILVLLLGTFFCFAFPIAHTLHGGIVLVIILHPDT
jgi:hypothetical protein